MNAPIDLSIVTSLYGSAPYLPDFYRRATDAARQVTAHYEIIFVNDGSPDDSLARAVALQHQDAKVVVIDLSRNFGHHKALMTGLMYAKGERVFILDSDLEDEPEWLLTFHGLLNQNACDVVYGVQEMRKGGPFERWSGHAFYWLFNLLCSAPIPANAVIARLMSRRYVEALIKHQEREIFLPGLLQITGFRQAPCPVTKHFKGSTTYSLAHKTVLFVNAITSFSDKPLVYIFYTGGLICGTSTVAILLLCYLRWNFGIPLMGWPSLIVSIWFLGGLTIFFIGILGIYLAHLFREVKQRPYTIVRDVYSTASGPPSKDS